MFIFSLGRISSLFISLLLALIVLFYYAITLYIHFVPELNLKKIHKQTFGSNTLPDADSEKLSEPALCRFHAGETLLQVSACESEIVK